MLKLISGAEISNFRSIRSISLTGLADFTAFAGLNNTGKSNVLRALNAFFNNETDAGRPVDLAVDYYRPDMGTHKSKRITVSAEFTLPGKFNLGKKLDAVKQLLGGDQFTISKTWVPRSDQPEYRLNGAAISADDRARIEQFLQLISFRYIPNRVLPVDVVHQEHQALRNALVRRLPKDVKKSAEVFGEIQKVSAAMVSPLTKRVKEALPDLGAVRLAAPQTWGDMVFAFGYRLQSEGGELADEMQGSGVQSLLMLETLYLIDRDFRGRFGWRQAAVWAVEEPESSMHTSLEARVASYLAQIAADPDSRLQVLCTTHSDLVVQYSTKAFVITKNGPATACSKPATPKEAVKMLSRLGVSRWAHPILHHPLDPLIILDGKYDEPLWQEAKRIIGPRRPVEAVCLEHLDPEAAGSGEDRTQKYIRGVVREIRSRPGYAPVVVVLDWDGASKVQFYRDLFSKDDPFEVLVWPEANANPRLGDMFRGTERFLSDRIVEVARGRGARIGTLSDGSYTVAKKDYDKAKPLLFSIVGEGISEDDLTYARPFITEVLKRAGVLT